jgi:chemosensory pili system protein ChpA (sensor histidine kinase/response regulator)
MIPLSRAASLIETCNHFIREHLLVEPDQPDWQELDSLADVVTSIEYYLERLGDDPEAPGEQLLDVAEKSLASLGFFPSELQVPMLDDVLSPSEARVMQEMQELDDPEIAQSLADVLANPVSSVNPPALNTPGSLLPPPAGEEPVDDELREVFLEETDEVLDILQEYLPRWAVNPDDKSALSEVRRAFHTLKGSGPGAGAGRAGLGGGEPAQPCAGGQHRAWGRRATTAHRSTESAAGAGSRIRRQCPASAK